MAYGYRRRTSYKRRSTYRRRSTYVPRKKYMQRKYKPRFTRKRVGMTKFTPKVVVNAARVARETNAENKTARITGVFEKLAILAARLDKPAPPVVTKKVEE